MWSDQDEKAYQELIENAGGDEAITMDALRDALDSLARRGILDKVEDNSYKMGSVPPEPGITKRLSAMERAALATFLRAADLMISIGGCNCALCMAKRNVN